MESFFVGLGYVAVAFGLCLLGVGAALAAWRGARLIISQQIDTVNAGAPEGDDRSPFPRPTGRD